MQNKEVFVFDVDGVIVDSTDECLVVAWNAYIDYIKSNKIKIMSISDAEDSYSKHFRSIRNYVKSMDEYLVVFNSLENEITSQSVYDRVLLSQNKDDLEKFGKCFFNARKELKDKNYNHWLALHHIYDGIIEFFKFIQLNYNVYIVTGKDKESVIDFLNFFDIEFDFNKIYDKNIAKNKLLGLEDISKKEKLDNSKITLLDDNIMHLLLPKQNGFKVILANWGYGFEEHFKIAAQNNIDICSLYDLTEQFRVVLRK
jgi:phosphoglycolate phosphatase-like HAD superfamily hydrolase